MYVFDFVNVVIEITILLFYCSTVFTVKKTMSIRFFLLPLLFVGVSTLTGMLHLPTQLNLTIAFAVALTAAGLLFEGTWKNKFFMMAVYMVAIFFADILATVIITFSGISYHMSGSDNITFVVGAMLSNIIRFWILAYVGKFLSRRITNLPISYWIFMVICPILSILSLVIFDFYLMQAQSASSFLVFIPAFCILYINFMVFRFFETFSSQIQLKVLEELAQQEKENYRLLQESDDELRALSHDMKNHTMVLREYLENGHAETALSHLKDMEQTIEGISAVVYTGNPAVDAAINIGGRKAHSAGIRYDVQILGKAEIDIEAADMSKLLSNAIDNAIEACAPCDDKYIFIELKFSEESLHIHIENATVLSAVNTPLLTIKKDKKNHGFGMRIMKKVIEKYQGMMCYESKNGVFYLDMVLKNKDSRAV